MAVLIADSGSTKTDWVCISPIRQSPMAEVHTVGLNPFHVSDDEVRSVLSQELLPQLGGANVDAVYFYGSGVRPEMESRVEGLLREAFSGATAVEAHSDLLGACRALCGDQQGIACILGTGANSCMYNGKVIIGNTPALGYILGDEGSGAVLGKHLIHDLYTGVLPQSLRLQFEQEMGIGLPEIICKTYREPHANRFLASMSEFAYRHLDHEGVRQIVYETFNDFCSYHLSRYPHREWPVSFVGSIAWYYKEQLQLVLQMHGYQVGTILQSPMEGLIKYHQP